MALFDGSILKKLGFPIAGLVVGTLSPPLIEAIQSAKTPAELGQKIEAVVQQHPEVVNNLNLESPAQSGTTWGMAGALLTALGAIVGMVKAGNYDPAVLGPLCATVLASVFGLWRRWGSNLKPLFSRK